MNLEKNIGENKYKHIYVFGCSHSLNTNSIDTNCKSYSDHLAEKLNIPIQNVYNYAINGSSNTENLYYLNCINSNLSFFHSNDDIRKQKYNCELPKEIYDDSLIIFQLTYWYRTAFQHTLEKKNGYYKIVPISQHRTDVDIDIEIFTDIFYKKLSNEIFLQRNLVLPIYYTLKGISNERNNISTILLSWEKMMDDNIQNYIIPELSNISKIAKYNKWTCHSQIFNDDLHLSPEGNQYLAEYLMKYITN
jgi:hypothetical protein